MYKVIFHLNEEEKVKIACRNIENLLMDIEEEGEQIEVELLIHAAAVKSCKNDGNEDNHTLKEIIEKGVRIAVCNNTLNGLGIKKEDLIDGAVVVTSGVGELTRKQYEGWAYIKP